MRYSVQVLKASRGYGNCQHYGVIIRMYERVTFKRSKREGWRYRGFTHDKFEYYTSRIEALRAGRARVEQIKAGVPVSERNGGAL